VYKRQAGVVTKMVCAYDGGHIATGGYNEIFIKGVGEPTYPCGTNPPPGAPPYVEPSPSPSPSATPVPLATPGPSPKPSPKPSP